MAVAVVAAVFAFSQPDVVPNGRIISYGDAPSQFAKLWVPDDVDEPPVVVLLHGGFWRRQGGTLDLMTPMAERLTAQGYAVWNVEYGRSGERFGGWPHTFDHVRTSLDHLDVVGDDYGVDRARVVLVGHSAGGHLALWAATERPVAGVIALAPVSDIYAAAADGLGNNAVLDLMGGPPDALADEYAQIEVTDLGDTSTVVIVGSDDDIVPARYSLGLVGSDVVEVELEGVEHLDMIRSTGPTADAVDDALGLLLPVR